jgi:hypothetical protein
VIEGMFWRLTTKEISELLEGKECEFSQKENRNSWMSDKQWMQRYVYKELYDIFFGEFFIILTE